MAWCFSPVMELIKGCKKFLYNRSMAWCFSPVMELIKESRILFDKIPFDRSSFSFHHAKADLNSFVWVIWFTLF